MAVCWLDCASSRNGGDFWNARLTVDRSSMSSNPPHDAPSLPTLVLTASDFVSNPTAIASRLGFSFQFPTEGLPVTTRQAPRPGSITVAEGEPVSTSDASSANTSVATLMLAEGVPGTAAQARHPDSLPLAEGVPVTTSRTTGNTLRRIDSRPLQRARLDVRGCRFYMLLGDARELWPQWHYICRRRVPWTVLEYVGTTDRLKCRYAGTVVFNRELIGNDGVKEFELTHQFVSRETLLEMLPSEPRFPYRQIRAKRFRCYDRRGSVAIEPGTMVSRFTEQSRCPHCKTPLFERELSTMCCFNGKFVLPRGRPNPPELEQMLNNREFPKCASR